MTTFTPTTHRNRLIAVTVAATLGAAVLGNTSTQAAEPGAYATLKGGIASIEDMNFRDPSTADLLLDAGTGWSIAGAVGYRTALGLRGEVELGYNDASVKGTLTENVQAFVPCGEIGNNPCLDPNVGGGVKGLSGMAMGYFDLNTGSAVTPYIGAGIGMRNIDLNVTTTGRLNDGPTSTVDVVNGSDTVFAYRIAAGAALQAGAIDVTFDYSYTGTGRPSLDGRSTYATFDFDRRLNSHQFTAGVRVPF